MKLKKILIIFGILVLVLIMAGLIVSYVGYLKMKKNADMGEITYKDYFPFGPGNLFNTINPVTPGPNTQPNNPNIKNNEINTKLIKVSNEPVAGYTFIQKEYFP